MGRYRDGFREHSTENTERLFADLGYKFSGQLENRFYLTLDRVDRQLPGGLTKEQLNDDPQQADPIAIAQVFNKKFNFLRLADKVSYKRTDTNSMLACSGFIAMSRSAVSSRRISAKASPRFTRTITASA